MSDIAEGTNQSKRTLYDRLKHELETDPTVQEEVSLFKRIGFYRLRGQLGAGKFARVKLGVHLLTNERVAIKIINKAGQDEKTRHFLTQEIDCMVKLHHPNIVQLFEVIESFSYMYLVMETASEGNLYDKVMREGCYTEDKARNVFAQIIAAVSYMHNNDIVHRDIKAQNIFYQNESTIKIGDFGFSTYSHISQSLMIFCGSPLYTAPELLTDQTYIGQHVDIWATGVTLFFMLSGNMPFRGSDLLEIKENINNGFKMPENSTPSCETLINGLLEVDIKQRFKMEDILGSVWLRGGTGILNPQKKLLTKLASKFSLSSEISEISLTECNPLKDQSHNVSVAYDVLDKAVEEEVVQRIKNIGLPVQNKDLDYQEEPNTPTAGTYRILTHKKCIKIYEEKKNMEDKDREREACYSSASSDANIISTSDIKAFIDHDEQSGTARSKLCILL